MRKYKSLVENQSGALWVPALFLLTSLSLSFLAWIKLAAIARTRIHRQIDLNNCVAKLAREFQRDFNQIEALNQILEITRLEVRAAPPQAKGPLLAQTTAIATAQNVVLARWKIIPINICTDINDFKLIRLRHSGIHYSRIPTFDSLGARPLEWKLNAIPLNAPLQSHFANVKTGFLNGPEIRFLAESLFFSRFNMKIFSGFKASIPPPNKKLSWLLPKSWKIQWHLPKRNGVNLAEQYSI